MVNWAALVLACSVAFWVGFTFRGIVELLISIKERLQRLEGLQQSDIPPEPEKRPATFAEPLTAQQIAANADRERIEKLNQGYKF